MHDHSQVANGGHLTRTQGVQTKVRPISRTFWKAAVPIGGSRWPVRRWRLFNPGSALVTLSASASAWSGLPRHALPDGVQILGGVHVAGIDVCTVTRQSQILRRTKFHGCLICIQRSQDLLHHPVANPIDARKHGSKCNYNRNYPEPSGGPRRLRAASARLPGPRPAPRTRRSTAGPASAPASCV